MRRSLTLLPLLVIVAMLLSAVPALARSDIAIGWSVPEGAGHDPEKVMAEVDKYIEKTGRKPAVWSLWSRWGDRHGDANGPCVEGMGSCSFPTASVEALHARGITPMVWWVFIDPHDPNGNRRYAQYDKIVKGVHDEYITDWATAARNAGQVSGLPVIVRFAHEAEGHWFPWSIGRGKNTNANFKQAWQDLWKAFKKAGARDHVRWLWAPHTPQKDNYPGDKFVDFVGITVLNFGDHKKWKTPRELLDEHAGAALAVTQKPIIVAEMGTAHKGGDKGPWIKEVYEYAYEAYPKIKAMVYLQVPHDPVNGPDWRLHVGDGGAGMAAYKKIAKRDGFQAPKGWALEPGTKAVESLPATSVRLDRLGIDLPVVAGDGVTVPAGSAAHYPGTAWPGEAGNAYLYAHAGEGEFLELWQVETGDRIEVDLADGSSAAYEVTEIQPVGTSEAVATPEPTDAERLTLQTILVDEEGAPRFVVVAQRLAEDVIPA